MRVRVETAEATKQLISVRRRVPAWRRALVERVARAALRTVIAEHPVETGQARDAWIGALAQLGEAGEPPADGGHAPGDARRTEGRSLGRGVVRDGRGRTQAEAANAVRYVRFLEYGTRRMAPFRTVRRALRALSRGRWRALVPPL